VWTETSADATKPVTMHRHGSNFRAPHPAARPIAGGPCASKIPDDDEIKLPASGRKPNLTRRRNQLILKIETVVALTSRRRARLRQSHNRGLAVPAADGRDFRRRGRDVALRILELLRPHIGTMMTYFKLGNELLYARTGIWIRLRIPTRATPPWASWHTIWAVSKSNQRVRNQLLPAGGAVPAERSGSAG